MKNYRITIKDMNPAYKNWSKEEIIMDNLGKSIVIDGVNEFGTPFSDDDRLCDLFDDGRVSTEFGGLFPLNQISLVKMVQLFLMIKKELIRMFFCIIRILVIVYRVILC